MHFTYCVNHTTVLNSNNHEGGTIANSITQKARLRLKRLNGHYTVGWETKPKHVESLCPWAQGSVPPCTDSRKGSTQVPDLRIPLLVLVKVPATARSVKP